jgi:hypothetical protein
VSTVPEVVVAAQLGGLPAKAKMFPDWLDAKDPSLCTITKRAICLISSTYHHLRFNRPLNTTTNSSYRARLLTSFVSTS